MPQKFKVDKDYHNSRFDRWFKAIVIELPQSLVEKIIRKNKVKVNRKKTKTSYRLQLGDIVEVYDISKFKISTRPKLIKYKPSKREMGIYDDLILEDNNNFLIINKPAGIAVQAGTKSFKNIIDVLKDTTYFENTKPFIVHRLDKETSGVLIIAKNREYAQLFTSLFRIRKIHKTYIALTYGKVSPKIKTMEDELTNFDNGRKVVQKAISHMKVLKTSSEYSLVELNPITGRKHKYFINKRADKIKLKNSKLMLHAYKIKFMINNVKYNFKAEYNEEFENFLKKHI
jgi:23S rRNA pseudouridine955/2504/2580 synthase